MPKFSRRWLCALVVLIAPLLIAAERSHELDRRDLAGIHTIALIGPAQPGIFRVSTEDVRRQLLVVQVLAGAIGRSALEESIVSGMKEGTLLHALYDGNTGLAAKMKLAIEKALETQGYDVTRLSLDRKNSYLLDDYTRLRVDADVILDLEIHAPLYDDSTTPDAKLAPHVEIEVKLMKNNRPKSVLFYQVYSYQASPPGSSRIAWIQVDRKYWFDNIDAANANLPLAVQGIQDVIPLIAARIADMLKP